MKQLEPLEAYRHLLEELMQGISDEVNFIIILPRMGLQGRVMGKGIGLAVKNILKYC